MRRPAGFVWLALALWIAAPTGFAWAAPTCADEDDPEPVFKVKTKAGPWLWVCGTGDPDVRVPATKTVGGDIHVWMEAAGQPAREIYASGEHADFWVSGTPVTGLLLEELLKVNKKGWVVAARATAQCTAQACQVAPPKCVLGATKNPFPGSGERLARRLQDKDLTGHPYVDVMIREAYEQALGGDFKAETVFSPDSRPDRLDAAAADDWARVSVKLQRARKIGCL